MKLASARRCLLALALSLSPFTLPAQAHADQAEARSATALRDGPSASGKVVERLPSGTRLSILEMSEDGSWAKVRTKNGREGWAPVASLRTRPDEPAAPPRPAAPAPPAPADTDEESLAKRRNVRPESWVSKSKYHEEDNKMTVVASKAELYGRPMTGGTVLGIVRRGEVVVFVRRSADKKWVQIDIGAGELAWVDARAVRMAADMPRSEPEEETPPPVRREERPVERAETPPPRRRAEPSPEDVRRSERSRDDELPPTTRRSEPEEEAPPPRRRRREVIEHEEAPKAKRAKTAHGDNYFDARVKLGFATVGERVRTNGTSTTLLRNYEHGTTLLAIGAQLGYSRAFGKLRLHIDAKYLVAAAGAVVYHQSETTSTQLQILDQNVGAGLAVGGFFDVAGGIDLRLRLGVDAWINQISPSNPPLAVSSDVLLGMAIGVELAMPAVVQVAERPMGFRVKLGALAPATRTQQPGLATSPENSTVGGYVGVALHFGLLRPSTKGQLHLELSYDFSFAFSHFTGACPPTTASARVCRDDSVTDANYSSSAHVGGIGLYYQY